MLALPLKTTDAKKVDWASALSRYVSRAYSKEHAAAHAEEFGAVAALHRQVMAAQAQTTNPYHHPHPLSPSLTPLAPTLTLTLTCTGSAPMSLRFVRT